MPKKKTDFESPVRPVMPDVLEHPVYGTGKLQWLEWRNEAGRWVGVAEADSEDGSWWVVVTYLDKGRRHPLDELGMTLEVPAPKMKVERPPDAAPALFDLPDERVATTNRTFTELRDPRQAKTSCDRCVKQYNAQQLGQAEIRLAVWRREQKGKVYLLCSQHRSGK